MELFDNHILDFDNVDPMELFSNSVVPSVSESDDLLQDLDFSLLDGCPPSKRRKTASLSLQDVSKKLEDWGLVLPESFENTDIANSCEDDSADSVFSEESFRSELSEEMLKCKPAVISFGDTFHDIGILTSGTENILDKDIVKEANKLSLALEDSYISKGEEIDSSLTCEIPFDVHNIDNVDLSFEDLHSIASSTEINNEDTNHSENSYHDNSSLDSYMFHSGTEETVTSSSLDTFDENSNASSDLGYSSPVKEDALSDIDIESIITEKCEGGVQPYFLSTEGMIGDSSCDIIEELKNLKSGDNSFISNDSIENTSVRRMGFDQASLNLDLAVQEEEVLKCGLDMFDFNLPPESQHTESDTSSGECKGEPCKSKNVEETDCEDLDTIDDSELDSEFWSQLFSESELADTYNCDYEDLLDSILTSAENLDPEYFQSLSSSEFDIDSVDPTVEYEPEVPKIEEKSDIILPNKIEVFDDDDIKEEIIEIKEEPREECISHLADHDYTLRRSSSLFLTPPHSSGEESESENSSTLPYTIKYNKHQKNNSLLKSSSQNLVKPQSSTKYGEKLSKYQHKKDLKFVFNLAVQNDLKKSNARSILKNKIIQNRESSLKGRTIDSNENPKSAKDMMKSILERKNLAKDIEEKREFVRNMKKMLRAQQREEKTFVQRAKIRSLEKEVIISRDRFKPDLKKYRKFEEERELHNSMERQRRVELKDNYDGLKAVIPNISSVDKVSKLTILNTASDYCKSLETRLGKLELMKQQQEENKRRLQERLTLLRMGVV